MKPTKSGVGPHAKPPKGSTTTILDNVEISSVGGSAASASTEEICCEKGSIILNTYRVESDAIESGGMGRVWRVHHMGWNVDLAMKRPRAEFFSGEKSKQDFINECDTWIKLGLHPNIVSCYYVRQIDGIPTIFSEWMEGGDLENAVRDGSLYRGFARNPAKVQERILDIAIQFARGLHYAHEAREEDGTPKAIIHQDVKPGNVLLTKDGEVKVADFGLARARAVMTVLEENLQCCDHPAFPTQTILCPSGGYTPAYCSMEQMDGKLLSRRTDLYSWAVSVMELYVGGHPWANGVIAGLSCRKYLGEAKVPVPEPMADLLARCLAAKPDDRPRDFGLVIAELRAIYRIETGADYPRESSRAAADTADSLNNHALSMVDLGKLDEAEKLWEKALRTDFSNFRCQYNYAITLWNRRKLDDVAFYDRILAQKEPSALWLQAMATISLIRRNNDKEAASFVEQLSALDPFSPALEPLRRQLEQQLSLGSGYLTPSEKSIVYNVSATADEVFTLSDNTSKKDVKAKRSPDGLFLLTNDGACLDAKTEQELWRFPSESNLNSSEYRFTYNSLAVLRQHNHATLIDCATGETRYQLEGASQYEIDFSRDGHKAVYSHKNGKSYSILDLETGASTLFSFPDVYLGDSCFVDTQGSVVACTKEDVYFFDAVNGRSLLTFRSDRDYEDDVCYDDVKAFTQDGLALIKSLEREVWVKIPDVSIPPSYELSMVSSHVARSSAVSKTEENCRLAQERFDQGDIIGAFRLLDQSRVDSTLQQHVPSLVLWTKLGAYFKRGKLITVLPTGDAPAPLPARGETIHTIPERLLYAVEGSDVPHVYVETKMTWAQDTYFDLDYSYSLSVYNSDSGELYFKISSLTTDSGTDKEPLDGDLHVVLQEDGHLQYTKDTWNAPVTINLRDPKVQIDRGLSIALPNGYFLKNTKSGVDIGGFLFQDVFEGLTPLWNADIVVCKNQNYRLVYQYIPPDEATISVLS